ncbi:MAG: DUF1273 domain-containing protein [Lachnospiraceae bacterium]|nr:DUF1273 domain-containing protein [Lachnospiraceae bacterium]
MFSAEVARGLIKDKLSHNEIFKTNGFVQSLEDDIVWELASSTEKLVKCWQNYNTGLLTGITAEDAQAGIIGVTGHRPEKLYGYDLTEPRWIKLKELFKKVLLKEKATAGVTGMALGTDQVFAMSVMELKEQGYDIKLVTMLPFKKYSCKWPMEAQILFKNILDKADRINYVSSELQGVGHSLQKRNEALVDTVRKLICVWDGSASGTKNCIEYADSKGVGLIPVNPKTIELF